jgi:hypothetical protein
MTGEQSKPIGQRFRQRKTGRRNTNNENARREKNMTELKKKILNLVERAATFQAQQKYAAAVDCLIQGLGIMAETIEEPKPKPQEQETDDTWLKQAYKEIESDAFKRNLTDADIHVIWKLGLAFWDSMKKYGDRLPHE